MRMFNNGTIEFHYFLNKNFLYSTKNAMRIMSLMQPKDIERYKFDATGLDWGDFFEKNFLGLRRYYFREPGKTNIKHCIVYAT